MFSCICFISDSPHTIYLLLLLNGSMYISFTSHLRFKLPWDMGTRVHKYNPCHAFEFDHGGVIFNAQEPRGRCVGSEGCSRAKILPVHQGTWAALF